MNGNGTRVNLMRQPNYFYQNREEIVANHEKFVNSIDYYSFSVGFGIPYVKGVLGMMGVVGKHMQKSKFILDRLLGQKLMKLSESTTDLELGAQIGIIRDRYKRWYLSVGAGSGISLTPISVSFALGFLDGDDHSEEAVDNIVNGDGSNVGGGIGFGVGKSTSSDGKTAKEVSITSPNVGKTTSKSRRIF